MGYLLSVDWATIYHALVRLTQDRVEWFLYLEVQQRVAERKAYRPFHSL